MFTKIILNKGKIQLYRRVRTGRDNRVATSHGNHGNHGKVMELFLVMEKVMEFQKSSK